MIVAGIVVGVIFCNQVIATCNRIIATIQGT
jgi:hypothetical protein